MDRFEETSLGWRLEEFRLHCSQAMLPYFVLWLGNESGFVRADTLSAFDLARFEILRHAVQTEEHLRLLADLYSQYHQAFDGQIRTVQKDVFGLSHPDLPAGGHQPVALATFRFDTTACVS